MKLAQKALKRFLKDQPPLIPSNFDQIKVWLKDFAIYFDNGFHLVNHNIGGNDQEVSGTHEPKPMK